MNTPEEEPVLRVLQAWYEARDAGEEPDLEQLCGGDESLLARVRDVLQHDPLRSTPTSAGVSGAGGTDVADPTVSPPFEQLGEFRLQAKIGEGGMGHVYIAEQVGLGRPVAVKVLRPETVGDEKARERLAREAMLASGLDHPNIVPVYAVGEDHGCSYVAMKWLAGPSLDALAGRVTAKEAARIGAAIARALAEAHASGIIHRDVKPANVILDRDEPYLVDFGLARSDTGATLSQAGQVVGTLAYMSPEQLRGDTVDGRTDVYSLGATLYELISGQRLHAESRPEHLIQSVLMSEALPVKLERRDRDLQAVIQKAVSKDPADRFASAAELAEELDRFIRDEPVRARPLGPVTRVYRTVKRRPRTSAAVLIALLIATGAVIAAAVQAGRTRAMAADRRGEIARLMSINDFDGARDVAEKLVQSTGSAADVELRDRVKDSIRFETLLDQLMSRYETQPLDFLRARVDEVAAGMADNDPWRRGIALALASVHLNDSDVTLQQLDLLDRQHGPTRASDALRALAEGREIPRDRAAESPLDHLVTFLAMRMTNQSIAERRSVIESAEDTYPEDFRIQLASCMQLVDERMFDAAFRLMRGLQLPKRPAIALRGKLAFAYLSCGRLEEAHQQFQLIPEQDRTGWDLTHLLTVLLYQEKADELELELVAARKRFPRDAHLMLFEARYCYGKNETDHPRELLQEVIDNARVSAHVEEAEGLMFLVWFNELWKEANDISVPPEKRGAALNQGLSSLASAINEFLPRASYGPARCHAYYVFGEIVAYNDATEATKIMRKAIRENPADAAPRLAYARIAHRLIDAGRTRNSEGQPALPFRSTSDKSYKGLLSLAHPARSYVEELLVERAPGQMPLTAEQRAQAWYYRLYFAEVMGDGTWVCEWIRQETTELQALGELLSENVSATCERYRDYFLRKE